MPVQPHFSTYSPTLLRAELVADPEGLGYSGYLALGDYVDVANLLNNVGSGSAYTVWRNNITPREIINSIQPSDFAKLTQQQHNQLTELYQSAPIDATLSGLRQNFQNVFSGSATLLSGFLVGVATEQGSRFQVLFGPGASVSDSQVSQAWNRASGT